MTRYRPAAVVAMLAALVLSSAAAARAQVLDQVPADALVVVKIKNIGDVSKKAADFMAALGVAEMQPELADPLGAAEQQMGIKQGVDRAGDFAFVSLDPRAADGDDEKSMLLLVPVSDYAAFVGNFAGAEADGAVTTFTPEGGEEMYAANWGKYAALSPTK